ncbi:hypothetical protein HFO58_11040 [Rhizobium leguminosarum]|uniref:hypothetical protein n=1 Tax=Rhizobium leguminosarum TaxID=384 RepID=UPI001C96FB57|nr:hypothetical protein [Rhizobium leguminosarum]MBY5533692.1 hypothetical protein [Rhizobium leguminosarum]
MADDINIPATSETVASPEPTAGVKKKRAPRRSKAELEDAAKLAAANPSTGRKRRAASTSPAVKAVDKRSAKSRDIKPAATRAPRQAEAVGSDEFAELLKLEEENKNLRNELAGKLRAENADLRKRLGRS